MVMYDLRFQPTMIIVVVFSISLGFCAIRLLLLPLLMLLLLMWYCVCTFIYIFCFLSIPLLCSTVSPHSIFLLYTLLIFIRDHKKNKIHSFFLSVLFVCHCCQKTFLSFMLYESFVFMRCLRIGSTQTAPFHLMLSLTWNKVFFITHVSAMCHTKSKSFPLVDGTFLFLSSCFEFSFHFFFLFAFIRLLFSRHTILRLQTFT